MKNVDKKAVGARIKQIRINKGYTLEEFGKIFSSDVNNKLNAGKSNVQKWEIGSSLPTRERLEIIAKKGNMTVNELLYGNIEKDVEELYQRLVKLPRGEFINLMMRVAIEVEEGVKNE